MITLDSTQQRFTGLLVGLFVLGVALLVGNLPGSPLRSGTVQLAVVLGFPLLIALLAYLRFAPSVIWWEIVLLGAWGFLGIAVTAFIGFLSTMNAAGGYPGAGIELLQNLSLFIAVTASLSIPYGLAVNSVKRNLEWPS
ncbi:hypothetical protein [Halorarius litoreus]|uniref:hypothetical protein n=1 Tax=Halorarius litoreus TaxID=2962676 RepID=UPI0020CFC879|nr:hypothetical protein [Halorarius litoreus]